MMAGSGAVSLPAPTRELSSWMWSAGRSGKFLQ